MRPARRRAAIPHVPVPILISIGAAILIVVVQALLLLPRPDADRAARRTVVRALVAERVATTMTAARDNAAGRSVRGIGGQEQTPDDRSALAAITPTIDPDRLPSGFYARAGVRLMAVGVARGPKGVVAVASTIEPAMFAAAGPVSILPATTATPDTISLPGADGLPVAHILPMPAPQAAWSIPVLAAGALLLLTVILTTGRIAATRRLTRIARHVRSVRETGTITVLPEGDGRGAVGSLVRDLNAMLRRLHDVAGQQELRSFRLGRSESRAAVMHNVRNALSPISTILSHGLAQPPVAERDTIERVVAELAREDVAPDRRVKLADYMMAAIDAAVRARDERLGQFETGRTALANVLEIIGQPQDIAGEAPILDRCDVTDLIARNGTIARYGDGQSVAVAFPAQPCWVRANRVILSQVIGNLFRNATEAIEARGGGGGQIIITLSRDMSSATVVITDDGEGFAPVHAPMLFQRGYSTRRAKSGGLGLHWCANWMATMGGSLRLDSDGPGLGARAILTLPTADPPM